MLAPLRVVLTIAVLVTGVALLLQLDGSWMRFHGG
jgi:hypothetical protein